MECSLTASYEHVGPLCLKATNFGQCWERSFETFPYSLHFRLPIYWGRSPWDLKSSGTSQIFLQNVTPFLEGEHVHRLLKAFSRALIAKMASIFTLAWNWMAGFHITYFSYTRQPTSYCTSAQMCSHNWQGISTPRIMMSLSKKLQCLKLHPGQTDGPHLLNGLAFSMQRLKHIALGFDLYIVGFMTLQLPMLLKTDHLYEVSVLIFASKDKISIYGNSKRCAYTMTTSALQSDSTTHRGEESSTQWHCPCKDAFPHKYSKTFLLTEQGSPFQDLCRSKVQCSHQHFS